MKTTIYFMKNTGKTLTLALLAAFTLFTSCEKESDAPGSEDAITNDEAVALVEGAMAIEAEGLTAELDAAIDLTMAMQVKSPTNPYCGIGQDSTVSKTFNTARFDGSLSTSWNWMLNCNDQDIPQSLTYSRTGNVNYESLRLISDDYSQGNWSMTNLVGGTEYLFNGTYGREGTQESKVRNQMSFTSEIDFVLSDLAVGKAKRQINSGTATFTLQGDTSDGKSYHLTGSINFLGDGAAEIVINGKSYSVDLY